MRLATVDIGTNAAKILIAECVSGGTLKPLRESRRMIRLGEGVDRCGTLTEGAIERLTEVLEDFQSMADAWHVEKFVVVGTSASRDVGDSVVEIVRERTGLEYRILSGEQEADISFEGAAGGLPPLEGQVTVCDIGGGSTELVKGTSDGCILRRVSLDIGSVRIAERYFSDQPPKPDELRAATDFIRHSLSESLFSAGEGTLLIGASDTHRLCLELQNALIAGQLPAVSDEPDPSWEDLRRTGVEQGKISYAQIKCWTECLLRISMDQVLSLCPEKLQGRADVFPAALLICLEVMNSLEQESVIVSQWGLCHGIARRIFRSEQL